jgi:hypothetical protein
MNEFLVSVEKTGYLTGYIEVEADDPTQAQGIVNKMILTGELSTSDSRINWNTDYEYDDHSFTTTGDVE